FFVHTYIHSHSRTLPRSTLFPYTTLFRSRHHVGEPTERGGAGAVGLLLVIGVRVRAGGPAGDGRPHGEAHRVDGPPGRSRAGVRLGEALRRAAHAVPP